MTDSSPAPSENSMQIDQSDGNLPPHRLIEIRRRLAIGFYDSPAGIKLLAGRLMQELGD
ncbi:MAG: hypothetical protein JWO05_16 [Gemmatimonadetes bacterium]|nr:hypothetical protein [Gemmatimonadota bacterium]